MHESPETLDLLLADVCHLHHGRIDQLLDACALYHGQPGVLFALWEREGMTQSELGERLHNTPATVTRMLQRMEKAGFIKRRPDPKDQRISRVYLTEAGWAVEKQLKEVQAQMENEVFGIFDAKEAALYRQFLERTRARLQELTENAILNPFSSRG